MDPSKAFDDVCGSSICEPSSSPVPYMYGDRRRYLALKPSRHSTRDTRSARVYVFSTTAQGRLTNFHSIALLSVVQVDPAVRKHQ